MKCISCGRSVETEPEWVEFVCPQCGNAKILRCGKCKRLQNRYECPKCKFVGP
jgi:predicted RNA-binding Zn-ribbon protein involved in translation (DUF1610 family)